MECNCYVKTYQQCWSSFPLFPQPHQFSNQEWCHAALPGLSGGSPGDHPVPGQGLSGRFQHQSQWRDDVSSCCRTNGPQHGHRMAGTSERRTLFTNASWFILKGGLFLWFVASCDGALMSFTSVLRWVSQTSAWRTGMATGPRPCTLRPAGATPRCWAGCCCTAERSWPTAGKAPRYTTQRRTANWRCVALFKLFVELYVLSLSPAPVSFLWRWNDGSVFLKDYACWTSASCMNFT